MPRKAKTEEPVVTEDSLAPQTDGTGTALENTPEPETSPASPEPDPPEIVSEPDAGMEPGTPANASEQTGTAAAPVSEPEAAPVKASGKTLPHPRLPHLLTQNDRSLPPSLP